MREIMETIATRKDFRLEWFSGTGAGGQHRNKHQNCCRITHIPTGLTQTGQNFRERQRNQKDAFIRLANMVVAHYQRDKARERYGNPERIRTYHKIDDRVVDHLSGVQLPYREVVGKGNIAPMIDARRAAKACDRPQ